MANNNQYDPIEDEKWGQTTVKDLLLLLCEKLNEPTLDTAEAGYVDVALNTDLKNGVRLNKKRIPPVVWRILSYLELPSIYIHPAVELEDGKKATIKGRTADAPLRDDGTKRALADAFYRVAGPSHTQRLRRPGTGQIRHMFIPFFTGQASAFVHYQFDVTADDGEWSRRGLIHVNAPEKTATKGEDLTAKIEAWLEGANFAGLPGSFPPWSLPSGAKKAAPQNDVDAAEKGKGKAIRRNLRLAYGISYLRELAFGRPNGFGTPENDLFSGTIGDAPPAGYRNRVRDCNDLLELAARSYCDIEGKSATFAKAKAPSTIALEQAMADVVKKAQGELAVPANTTEPEHLQGVDVEAQRSSDALISLANALVSEFTRDAKTGGITANDAAEEPPDDTQIALPYIMYPSSPEWYIHSAVDLSEPIKMDEPQGVVGGRRVARLILHAFRHSQASGSAKPDKHALKHLLIPLYQTMALSGKTVRYYSLLHYTFETRNVALHQLSDFDVAGENDPQNRKWAVVDLIDRFRFADMPDYCCIPMPTGDGATVQTYTFGGNAQYVQDRHHYTMWHVVQTMYALITQDANDKTALGVLESLDWNKDLGLRTVHIVYSSLLHLLTRAGRLVASNGADLISWLHDSHDGTQKMNPAHRAVFVEIMDAINDWHTKEVLVEAKEADEDTDAETTDAVKKAKEGRADTLKAQARRREARAQVRKTAADRVAAAEKEAEEREKAAEAAAATAAQRDTQRDADNLEEWMDRVQDMINYLPDKVRLIERGLREQQEQMELDERELDIDEDDEDDEDVVMKDAPAVPPPTAAGAAPLDTDAADPDEARDLEDIAGQLIQCIVEAWPGRATYSGEVLEAVQNWRDAQTQGRQQGDGQGGRALAGARLRLVLDPTQQRLTMSVGGGTTEKEFGARAGGNSDFMAVDLPLKVRVTRPSPGNGGGNMDDSDDSLLDDALVKQALAIPVCVID